MVGVFPFRFLIQLERKLSCVVTYHATPLSQSSLNWLCDYVRSVPNIVCLAGQPDRVQSVEKERWRIRFMAWCIALLICAIRAAPASHRSWKKLWFGELKHCPVCVLHPANARGNALMLLLSNVVGRNLH